MTMGGSAIAFGFLFGELFGDLGKGWLRPLLFDRTERMISYLWLALAIGVAHVLLGHLLGIIGALRLRKPRQATERAATMAAIFGGLLLLGAGVKLIPSGWFTPGLILMLAMVPVLLYAGGLVALLELVSTAGHILSYARLMALGVAGAMLAHVANTLGSTEGNVVLGILVALLLHLLHLVMSLFSPTIQALRLH
jgi:V/A-type H+-transporting ATPase subunit I